MKVKKYLTGCFLALFTVVLTLGFTSCGGNNDNKPTDSTTPSDGKVVLEDWEEKSEATVSLGDNYRIKDQIVTGSNGKEYYCDVTVTDSKGEKMIVVGGEFEVLDLGGYTVEYVAQITSDDIRTRELTLKVVDDSAPKVLVSMPTGFVNTKYTIPAITVTDLSGEDITPTYKVYLASDSDKTPIKITNGSFTPTVKGTYSIEIKAKDSAGNEAKVVKNFGIRADAPENILENFDDSSSLLNSINGSDQEWLETFEGRNGVIRIPGTDAEKTQYLFRFMRGKDTYKHVPFDSITVSLYVSKHADLYETSMQSDDGNVLLQYWFGAEVGGWRDFTITHFDDWDYFFKGATSDKGGQLFWTWTRNADIYIDEIRFAVKPTIEFESSAVDGKVASGDEVSVSASVKADSRLVPYLTVYSPSGAKVAYEGGKFTANETGWYVIKAVVESAEWSFYDTSAEYKILCLGNYIKVGDAFKETDIGTEYLLSESHEVNTEFTLPSAKVINAVTGAEVGGEITVKVTRNGSEFTVTGGKFTPTVAGVYTATYTSGDYTTVCKIYVVDGTLAFNELENFGLKNSVSRVKYGADGEGIGLAPEWLPEFEGRAGVVKVNDKGSQAGYTIRINKTYAEVKALDWDYFEIDVYLKSEEWLCYGKSIDEECGDINPSARWKKCEWTTISILRSEIDDVDKFLQALTSTSGAHIFWVRELNNDVYIDGLRFRSQDGVLNSFDDSSSKSECSNGNVAWLESYQGKEGVLKVNDGGNKAGFYFKTNRISAAGLESVDWENIEITLYATNRSWIYFDEAPLNVYIEAGQWTTLKISKATIESQMSLNDFCEKFTSKGNGLQLFWGYQDMGDVYFDEIIIK